MAENNIPVIAFSGYSGSGKTMLIEKLIRILKVKGLRLAVVKHDGHSFEIDQEGKDSWRFTRAGADVMIISSDLQTARIEKGMVPLAHILGGIHDVDLILVEGYKYEKLPRIGIARRDNGKGFTMEPDDFLAIVTDMEIETSQPCFGLDDAEKLAEFILEKVCNLREGSIQTGDTGRTEIGKTQTMIEKEQTTEQTEAGRATDFTHFDENGRARMVDVGEKPETRRTAVAAARVLVNQNTFDLIKSGGMKKGDVLTVAQIAGIMGAKRTPDLIPMCHPILIDGVRLSLHLDERRCSVEIEAQVRCDGHTGVEMEALTAVTTAALTVYDMCKAVQKDMVIQDIRLLEKTGGVHGDYRRPES